MNEDQKMVSWLAVFGIIIGVMLVYRSQLSAILFGAPGAAAPPVVGAQGTIVPSQGNPSGTAAIQPTTAPPGQSGQFGVDQNGGLYKNVGGAWVPWGTTSNPLKGVA